MNMPEGSTLNVPELRRLLEAATPGPWRHSVAGWIFAGEADVVARTDEAPQDADERDANADLVAAAVNALPALLDRLEAAELVATAADNYVTLNASFDELEDAVHAYREAGPS